MRRGQVRLRHFDRPFGARRWRYRDGARGRPAERRAELEEASRLAAELGSKKLTRAGPAEPRSRVRIDIEIAAPEKVATWWNRVPWLAARLRVRWRCRRRGAD